MIILTTIFYYIRLLFNWFISSGDHSRLSLARLVTRKMKITEVIAIILIRME